MTGHKHVDEISHINLSGNIIPSNWYKNITRVRRRPNSEGIILVPDLEAITILAEIVYWYRRSEVRDDLTGEVKGYKTKFKADKLQRSIRDLADKFGFSYKQVRDALNRLEAAGLIKKEYREVRTGMGTLSNVLYIDVVPEAILRITDGVNDFVTEF
jgi:hypothetical protein